MHYKLLVHLVVSGTAGVILMTSGVLRAQSMGALEEAEAAMNQRWRLSIGGSLNTVETRAAWAPMGLAGAVIELEDRLGLADELGTVATSASYRVNDRHSFAVSLMDIRRKARESIEEDIEWGDYVFRAGGSVETRFNTTIGRAKWRYNFSNDPRLRAGFSVGLSTFLIDAALEGEARIDGDDGSQWVDGVVERVSFIAPVPLAGFFLEYDWKPGWALRFNADAFDLNVGNHRGRVQETAFFVHRQVTRTVGVGAGISALAVEYSSLKDGELFAVDYRIRSVNALVSFAF